MSIQDNIGFKHKLEEMLAEAFMQNTFFWSANMLQGRAWSDAGLYWQLSLPILFAKIESCSIQTMTILAS